MKMFEVYVDIIKCFKGRYYMVRPFIEDSHATNYDTYPRVPSIYTKKFPKLLHQNHFLAGMRNYIYSPDDFSQKEAYLKNKHTTF